MLHVHTRTRQPSNLSGRDDAQAGGPGKKGKVVPVCANQAYVCGVWGSAHNLAIPA